MKNIWSIYNLYYNFAFQKPVYKAMYDYDAGDADEVKLISL